MDILIADKFTIYINISVKPYSHYIINSTKCKVHKQYKLNWYIIATLKLSLLHVQYIIRCTVIQEMDTPWSIKYDMIVAYHFLVVSLSPFPSLSRSLSTLFSFYIFGNNTSSIETYKMILLHGSVTEENFYNSVKILSIGKVITFQ